MVDTYAHWSLFGKVVILILIQLGGLGIVTAISMVMLFLRRRFSLRSRTLLLDALNLDSRLGLLSFLTRIFKWTLIVEGLGAALYCFAFIPRFGPVPVTTVHDRTFTMVGKESIFYEQTTQNMIKYG